MARKSEPPKPLFDVKHVFIAAFENVCHQATMVLTAIETVLAHDKTIGAGAKEILAERAKALRDAMYAKEPD